MASALPRTKLSEADLWCFEATMAAFGIEFRVPQRPGQRYRGYPNYKLVEKFRRAGYVLGEANFWVQGTGDWPEIVYPTLTRFIRDHPSGDYLVCGVDHIMALRDGQLTDTDMRGTGRRRVQHAWTVTRR